MDAQMIHFLDQERAHVADTVRRFGWSIQFVACDCTDSAPFAYTVGLFGMGHPELLIFGTSQCTSANVLNDLGERVRAGAQLGHGDLLTFDGWPRRVELRQVPNPGEILFTANEFYLRPDSASVPALQAIWDDVNGKFPWDEGYSLAPDVQPMPGAFRA
jgi:hypothetical protein